MFTPTRHRIASLILLDPEITLAALFKFTSFDELQKLIIILTMLIIYFVFSTTHTCMIWGSAVKTVSYIAYLASEITLRYTRLEHKGVLAVW